MQKFKDYISVHNLKNIIFTTIPDDIEMFRSNMFFTGYDLYSMLVNVAIWS